MIIHRGNIHEAIAEMWHEPFLALDTETTGLSVWHGDRLFLISFASEHKVWSVRIGEGRLELPRSELVQFQPLFDQFFRVWFMHNAKFDIGMLEAEGLKLSGTIWDTVTGERLAFNAYSSYSLDACAKRLGLEKLGSVEEYIKKNKLYENVPVPGKKIRKKKMFFNLVEPNLLREYAEQDVRVTYKLGTHQRFAIRDIIDELHPKLRKGELCYEIEKEVTKVCYEIEKTGIRVDKNYCERADRFESDKAKEAANRFKELTGVPLVNSAKGLSPVFTQRGFIAPKTDKENDQFDDEVLSKWGETSEEARLVLAYREAEKKANTYYKSFLFHSDVNSVLHVNLNQAGTSTGRFSSQSPNLQNLPKEEDLTPEFLVRRSFIPREGCSFFMLDYDQMEYAVMLDYAGETSLIEKVKNGLDVHTATAELLSVSRKQAKCIAEDSLVLTHVGLVKIQDIKSWHLVWDGVAFVKHEGVIYKGEQECWQYQGLSATGDHRVYTKNGRYVSFKEAILRKYDLVQTEDSGHAIRYSEPFRLFLRRRVQKSLSRMLCLQKEAYNIFAKYINSKNKNMSLSKGTKILRDFKQSYTEFKYSVYSASGKMHFTSSQILQGIWRERCSSANYQKAIYSTFPHQVYRRTNNERAIRSDQHFRKLCGIQSQISSPAIKFSQQKKYLLYFVQRKKDLCAACLAFIKTRLSKFFDNKTSVWPKLKSRENYSRSISYPSKTKKKVYDIVNAGPRNRFTVSGYLVSNCVNFSTLYGAGAAKLANQLGCSLSEAKSIKAKYFEKLPKVKALIQEVIRRAQMTGFIYNRFGRKYHFEKDFAYKAPNYLIQGSCADAMKLAMVRAQAYLKDYKSKIVLQVHDELVLEVPKGEEFVVSEVRKIMEGAYPASLLPLTVGVEWSPRSLADKEEWVENQSQTSEKDS